MSTLPIGWAKFNLKDLGGTQGGKTPSKSVAAYWSNGTVPWTSPKDMRSFVLNDSEDKISEGAVESAGMKVFPKGSVLFVTRSGILTHTFPVALANVETTVNQDIKVVVPNELTFPKYLAYLLKCMQSEILEACSKDGTTVASVETALLEKKIFPLAPLPEQIRIAVKLDTLLARVDAARERLERVPALLRRFRQSVLAAATSGELTDEWRGGRKAEWREADLQFVAQIGTGSTPLRANKSFYAEQGAPWITSAATSERFVISAKEFVTVDAIKAHRLKVYPVGTLLVAMYGEGKTRGQVTELGIPATINQACAAIQVDEGKADRRYVRFVLEANYYAMRELAEGGNQPNLNLTKVKEFPILIPLLDEQAEIIRRAEALFALADRVQAQYATARAHVKKLTSSLLAKAFRGELVPQDPNDEPASVLLERLQARKVSAAKPAKQDRKSSATVRKGRKSS